MGDTADGDTADIDRSPGEAGHAGSTEQRVVAAALRCIARWGLGKTTADDIAREAGMSRATLYRAFPGGREVVLAAVLRHEVGRFFATVTTELDRAETLEDLLVCGLVEADAFLRNHAALGYLIDNEPGWILPATPLDRLGRVTGLASAFAEPHLARFVGPDRARAGAEMITRLALSYALVPAATVDLTDHESVRRFVRTLVLPGLTSPDDPPAGASPSDDLRTRTDPTATATSIPPTGALR
jgi:AcrR family transcriptional regulator